MKHQNYTPNYSKASSPIDSHLRKFYNSTCNTGSYWTSYQRFEAAMACFGYHKQTIKKHYLTCLKKKLLSTSKKKGWIKINSCPWARDIRVEINKHKDYYIALLDKTVRKVLRKMDYRCRKQTGISNDLYNISVKRLAELMNVSIRTLHIAKMNLLNKGILIRKQYRWRTTTKRYCDSLNVSHILPERTSWGVALSKEGGCWYDH